MSVPFYCSHRELALQTGIEPFLVTVAYLTVGKGANMFELMNSCLLFHNIIVAYTLLKILYISKSKAATFDSLLNRPLPKHSSE